MVCCSALRQEHRNARTLDWTHPNRELDLLLGPQLAGAQPMQCRQCCAGSAVQAVQCNPVQPRGEWVVVVVVSGSGGKQAAAGVVINAQNGSAVTCEGAKFCDLIVAQIDVGQ